MNGPDKDTTFLLLTMLRLNQSQLFLHVISPPSMVINSLRDSIDIDQMVGKQADR